MLFPALHWGSLTNDCTEAAAAAICQPPWRQPAAYVQCSMQTSLTVLGTPTTLCPHVLSSGEAGDCGTRPLWLCCCCCLRLLYLYFWLIPPCSSAGPTCWPQEQELCGVASGVWGHTGWFLCCCCTFLLACLEVICILSPAGACICS